MELNKHPFSSGRVLCSTGTVKCARWTSVFLGEKALGKSSWMQFTWQARSSLAGGQGALQSGVGRGCPHSSPTATRRGDAATIQKQAATSIRLSASSRHNFCFNLAGFLALSVSHTHTRAPCLCYCFPHFPVHTTHLPLAKSPGTPQPRPSTWRNLKFVHVLCWCLL